MALARPTLTEIIDRVLADLSSRMVGTDGAVLRRSVLGAMGRALAGASHELHGRLDYLARQITVDTADSEYLERWASVWGVRRRAAAYAVGSVTFAGTNGATIAAGTLLRRQDGAQIETTALATIASGTATVAARARLAGSAGNTTAGAALILVSPSSGVTSTATVAAGGLTGGADTEDDDALRARVLERIRMPPQGGAERDYRAWALEVPGVTRVWVAPQEMGAGTVTVRFVRDGDASIIPDPAEVAVVADYIAVRRPVTAEVYVVAPVAMPIDMTIQIAPNTPTVQAAIQAELADLLRRDAEPGGVILVSRIRESISVAAGESDHVLLVPAGNVVQGTGEIAVLGTITWQPIP